MKQVGIIDDEAVKYAPSSKFLTKEEMQTIDPKWIWNRKSFIFKYQIPLYVDENVAEAVVNKYQSVRYEKIEHRYENVNYNDLKKVAVDKGIPWGKTFVKREELITMISQV